MQTDGLGLGTSGAGDLKFKSDPCSGREPAAGREGPRAQEASAFKGPEASTQGSAPLLAPSVWNGGKPRLLGVIKSCTTSVCAFSNFIPSANYGEARLGPLMGIWGKF